ncbi:hypothetical protein PCCS19_02110 [Paenibacillus sp. CCS19]|nr:hypothetical protein PCCS19_02110 [Paenibacillus cellulosilyticus]
MIRKMTHFNRCDFNKSNEGFMVIGRIVPSYKDGKWTYTEELLTSPYFKQYEHEVIDDCYMNDEDKAVFLYYSDEKCVGQIQLRSNWNRFAYIDHIGIAETWRRRGIGSELLA